MAEKKDFPILPMPRPSTGSKVSKLIMRGTAMKKRQQLIPKLKKQNRGAKPSAYLSRAHQISQSIIDGCNVWYLKPRAAEPVRSILYLHGGAYARGQYAQHWRFVAMLADSLNSEIIFPEYPLAPDHHAPEVHAMVADVYSSIITRNNPSKLIFMGDSAGGGLALALAQQLYINSKPLPQQLVLFAPWVDITMTNPEIHELDAKDPLLNVDQLIKAGKAYAGDLSPRDPLVSPLYGDLKHIPPTLIFTGTADVLLADCRSLKKLALEAGSEVELLEVPEMPHPGVVMPIPERDWIVEQIKDRLQQLP